VEFILRIQRQRRNLTREAMGCFRGVEYNARKERRGGRHPGQRAKGQSDPLPSTAVKVAGHGDPEVRRKLLGADVRLTAMSFGQLLHLAARIGVPGRIGPSPMRLLQEEHADALHLLRIARPRLFFRRGRAAVLPNPGEVW
jgi:hypothetical protein